MPRMPLSNFLGPLFSRDRGAEDFDRLLREHVPAFYRAAYRWTGTVDQAEDLVQDLLVRLYPRLDELRALDQVKPWALRVMYRLFVDRIRRQHKSPVRFEGDLEEDGAEDRYDGLAGELEPEVLVERELAQERIVAAWGQLSDEHRVVLSMHDIEEYSLVEIAEMTDTPVGTLKSRVHRARAKLRDLLERTGRVDRVGSSRKDEP